MKLLKKIAALGCAFVMFTTPFSFAGCTKEKKPLPEPEQPPIVQPVETEQDKAEKLYDSLVKSMKNGNFTLKNGNKTYKFDGDKAEIDGAVYFSENGKDVCITDGVKNFSELNVATAKSDVVAQFDGVEFDNFENGVLSGSQADGDEISVTVSSDKIELTVKNNNLTASNIGTTTVNLPTFSEDKTVENPPVEKTLQEAAAEINAFLDGVKQSQKFTFTETKNSKETKYSFLNGLMRVEKDGTETIYEEVEGQKYAYSNQNGAWNKDFTDKSVADAFESFEDFANTIEGLSWSDFDAQKNQLSGTYNGKNVTAKLNDNILEMNIDDADVTVSKTVENFAKPTAFTDNTIQSEKLWETVAGQRVYNYKLLAQTLEDWIKENDYLKTYYYGDNYKLNNILFLNNESNQIRLYALITYNNNKYQIRDYTINVTNLSEDNNSPENLKKYLTSTNKPIKTGDISPINIEYSSLNATPEQKTEMEGLTTSVFKELATDGWRTSREGQATKLEYFKDLKVLFSARSPLSDTSVGGDLGDKKSWHQYYLVDNNGELQWIDLIIGSAILRVGSIQRVIEDTDNLWFCEQPKTTNIDKGNSQLYEDVLTTAKSLNL